MSQARDRQAGLTLIEVLVVLVIIAVMAGMTVLGLGSLGRGNQAEAEARRLADRLQLASDDVLVAERAPGDGLGPGRLPLPPLGRRGRRPGSRAARRCSTGGMRARGAEAGAGRRSGSPPLLITPDLPQPAVEFRILGGARPGRWPSTASAPP